MVKSLSACILSLALLTGCSATPTSEPTASASVSSNPHLWSQEYTFNSASLDYLKWTYSENINGWYKTYTKPNTSCILNIVDESYDLFWSELDKTKTESDVEKIVLPTTIDSTMTAKMKSLSGDINFFGVRQLLADAIVDSYYSGDFNKKTVTVFSITCDFDNTKTKLEANWNNMDEITNEITSKALLETK